MLGYEKTYVILSNGIVQRYEGGVCNVFLEALMESEMCIVSHASTMLVFYLYTIPLKNESSKPRTTIYSYDD